MRNLDKNSLVNKNDPEKGNEYAFDNPYFKDDDVDTQINGTFNSSQKLTYEGKLLFYLFFLHFLKL